MFKNINHNHRHTRFSVVSDGHLTEQLPLYENTRQFTNTEKKKKSFSKYLCEVQIFKSSKGLAGVVLTVDRWGSERNIGRVGKTAQQMSRCRNSQRVGAEEEEEEDGDGRENGGCSTLSVRG